MTCSAEQCYAYMIINRLTDLDKETIQIDTTDKRKQITTRHKTKDTPIKKTNLNPKTKVKTKTNKANNNKKQLQQLQMKYNNKIKLKIKIKNKKKQQIHNNYNNYK